MIGDTMWKIQFTSWIILLGVVLLARGSDFTGLDESKVVFKINWPGKSTAEFPVSNQMNNQFLIEQTFGNSMDDPPSRKVEILKNENFVLFKFKTSICPQTCMIEEMFFS